MNILNSKRLRPLFFQSYSARTLAACAAVLWIVSLGLPGIVAYSPQGTFFGAGILAMGWLAIAGLNFAWIANLFFVWAVAKTLSGSRPQLVSAWLAGLFALDTFRFSQVPLNEAGSSSPVFGYGWGAVLWFAAIFFAIGASLRRRAEIEGSTERKVQASANVFSVKSWAIVACLAGVLAAGLAFYDRRGATEVEKHRLNTAPIKQGKVCRSSSPVAAQTVNLTSALELVGDRFAYPFDSPAPLLDWGVPVVRMNGFDYFLSNSNDARSIAARRAEGASSVRLVATREAASRSFEGSIRLKLSSETGLLFDEVWQNEHNFFYFCPEYHSFPTAHQQPRALVVSALNLNSNVRSASEQVATSLNGRLVNESTFASPLRGDPNNGCPADVGYRSSMSQSNPETLSLGRVFKIGDTTHFILFPTDRSFACSGPNLYFVSRREPMSAGTFAIAIEKRTLPDFKREWHINVSVPISKPQFRSNELLIYSIREEDRALAVTLANYRDSTLMRIQLRPPS